MFATRIFVITETITGFIGLEIVDGLRTADLTIKVAYETALFMTALIIMIRTYRQGKKKNKK